MNSDLSLTLELLEHSTDWLLFRLLLRNQTSVKLLLPFPEIHGLRFANKATTRESEWYTSLLVSTDWAGIALEPFKERAIEYRVRPCTVDRSSENDFSDYYRWCVDLPNGDYLVWFELKVDRDYFCCDSHYRYENLLREAEVEHATVWIGETRSNSLHLIRA